MRIRGNICGSIGYTLYSITKLTLGMYAACVHVRVLLAMIGSRVHV